MKRIQTPQSTFDEKLDGPLNEFLLWHWQQFKTGKYKHPSDIPYSWTQQNKAKAANKALVLEEVVGNNHMSASVPLRMPESLVTYYRAQDDLRAQQRSIITKGE